MATSQGHLGLTVTLERVAHLAESRAVVLLGLGSLHEGHQAAAQALRYR